MIKRWTDYTTELKISAGIVLILNKKKILLVHPTKAKWYETYSVPKGGIESGESDIDAAIRELREETSIELNPNLISNPSNPIEIFYENKQGKKYKKLILFTVYISKVEDIGLKSEGVDRMKLQLSEVDWCGFLDKKEAKLRIFHRMYKLLDLIQ